jgi:hypothetical protein
MSKAHKRLLLGKVIKTFGLFLCIIKNNARTVPDAPLTKIGQEMECHGASATSRMRRIIVFKSAFLINKNGAFNLCGVVDVVRSVHRDGCALYLAFPQLNSYFVNKVRRVIFHEKCS